MVSKRAAGPGREIETGHGRRAGSRDAGRGFARPWWFGGLGAIALACAGGRTAPQPPPLPPRSVTVEARASTEGPGRAERRPAGTETRQPACAGYPPQPTARWRPAIGQPWRTAGPFADATAADPRERWQGMPARGNIYPFSGRQNERGYQNAEALELARAVLDAGGPDLLGLTLAAQCNGVPTPQEAVDVAFTIPEGHPVWALAMLSARFTVSELQVVATVVPPAHGGRVEVEWGDGLRGSELVHTYAAAGSYGAKVWAEDAAGEWRVVGARLQVPPGGEPPPTRPCVVAPAAPGAVCRCTDGARPGTFRPNQLSTGRFEICPLGASVCACAGEG